MSRTIEAFKALPEDVKDRVIMVARKYHDRPDVRNRADFYMHKMRVKNPKDALNYAAFDRVRTRTIVKRPELLKNLVCFDVRGNRVIIDGGVKKGKHVALLRGSLISAVDEDGRVKGKTYPVIIKYYRHGSEDITRELKIYRELRNRKVPTPWFSTGFFLWNSRVLILEPMLEVKKEHNEFELGLDVLQQMEAFHKCGIVHNDIKPLNIMVKDPSIKVSGDSITAAGDSGGFKFRVIDHGGDATDRLKHGYRRRIWTPKWCCQKKGQKHQVTTPKHDLIELGFTMKTMQCWRKGLKQIRDKKTKKYVYDPYRNYFYGSLKKYMDRVDKIDETKRHLPSKDYEDLAEILTEAMSDSS